MKRIVTLALMLCVFIGMRLTASPAAALDCVPSPQGITVNGEVANCAHYNIDGYNYFRLRDLAYLLNGTTCEFSIDYDPVENAVVIQTAEPYVSQGVSPIFPAAETAAKCVVSRQKLRINGETVCDMNAYNIWGNNYFQLRQLSRYIRFQVDYDAETKTAMITAAAAQPDYEGFYRDVQARMLAMETNMDFSRYHVPHNSLESAVDTDPFCYFLASYMSMQNKAGCLTTVSASYSVTKEEADARRMRLKELADSILAQSVTSEMDDCAKAKALHDYLCLHCTYDKRDIPGQSGPASTEGVLRYGRAICLGYARAYKYLLDLCGIPCEVVHGLGGGNGHAWNQVQIDGEWYHVDVTWDDPDNGSVLYEYFLKSDGFMSKNHSNWPNIHTCDSTLYDETAPGSDKADVRDGKAAPFDPEKVVMVPLGELEISWPDKWEVLSPRFRNASQTLEDGILSCEYPFPQRVGPVRLLTPFQHAARSIQEGLRDNQDRSHQINYYAVSNDASVAICHAFGDDPDMDASEYIALDILAPGSAVLDIYAVDLCCGRTGLVGKMRITAA